MLTRLYYYTQHINSSRSITTQMQKMRLQIMVSVENIKAMEELRERWHLPNISNTFSALLEHFADLVGNYKKLLKENEGMKAELFASPRQTDLLQGKKDGNKN